MCKPVTWFSSTLFQKHAACIRACVTTGDRAKHNTTLSVWADIDADTEINICNTGQRCCTFLQERKRAQKEKCNWGRRASFVSDEELWILEETSPLKTVFLNLFIKGNSWGGGEIQTIWKWSGETEIPWMSKSMTKIWKVWQNPLTCLL